MVAKRDDLIDLHDIVSKQWGARSVEGRDLV